MDLGMLNTMIDGKYYILRKFYILIFILLLVIRSIVLDNDIVWSRLDPILFSIILVTGLLFIFWDILNNKYLFMARYNVWLCVFMIAFFISIIFNYKYGVFSNIRLGGYTCIFFFLMYPVYFKRFSESVYNEIKLIGNVCLVIYFITTLVSLYMFIFQIGYVEYSTKIPLRRGFYENRLFGVFPDPNDAAVISIIIIIFCIFNYKNLKKVVFKVFYVISVIFQFIYIVLSGSRTAELISFILCIFITWSLVVYNWRQKNYNVIMKHIIALVCGVLIGIILMLLMSFTRYSMSYVPSLVNKIGLHNNGETKVIKKIVLKREDVENSDDISNLRFSIWKDAIDMFKVKPIFGFSPRNFSIYIKNEFSNGFMAKHKYTITHNMFIEVLVCTGIAGLICVVGYFINILKDLLKYIFTSIDSKYYKIIIFTSAIILTIAIESMFFTEIFFINNVRTLLFWLFLGYTMYFIEKEDSKLIDKKMPITYVWCTKLFNKIKGTSRSCKD